MFSVVIPVHNRSDSLPRAVRSAFEQTVGDVEVVVVDDGSDDESSDVARELRPPAGATLRIIRQETRSGGGAARNIGMDAATGTYFAFLDSDDEWDPTKLERQLEHLADNPHALALTGFRRHLENTVRRGVPGVLGEPDPLHALLGSRGGPLTCSIMAVDAETAREHDLRFDERFPALQDLDFAITAAIKGFDFVGVEAPLVRKNRDPYREHVFGPENEVLARRLILDKYREYFAADDTLLRIQRRKLVLAMRQMQTEGLVRPAGRADRPSQDRPRLTREMAAQLRLRPASAFDRIVIGAYRLDPWIGDFLLKAGANQDRAQDFWRWLAQRTSDIARDVRSNRSIG